MTKDAIQVFVTGGTFDKEYNFITGELYFQDSHLVDMFDQGRSTLNLNVKTLMMIDSLEMTDLERNVILKNCKNAVSNKLLITHGTDTVVETAEFLAKAGLENKTIVLTGAMIPIAFGSSSADASNRTESKRQIVSSSPPVIVGILSTVTSTESA